MRVLNEGESSPMRTCWNRPLSALGVAFSLACSPSAPVAEDTPDVASNSSETVQAETVTSPPAIGLGWNHLELVVQTDPRLSELFSGDFNPTFPGLAGADPWDALGELTGRYEVSVTRLSDDCEYGPDVPFYANRGSWWSLGDEVGFPFSESYDTSLVQRGDAAHSTESI